ncbi:MAG: hypothetical protein CMH49_07050 [Myxococcales bacterium]|nr:hypothetical protein [Myxococcales bacterium]
MFTAELAAWSSRIPRQVQCILTDLSTNGTFVNRRCIGRGQSAVLTSGDEVHLLVCSLALLGTARYAQTLKVDFLNPLTPKYSPQNPKG